MFVLFLTKDVANKFLRMNYLSMYLEHIKCGVNFTVQRQLKKRTKQKDVKRAYQKIALS